MKKDRKMKRKYTVPAALLLVITMMTVMTGMFAPYVSVYAENEGETQTQEENDNREYISKKGYNSLSEEEKAKKGTYADAAARIADMQLVAQDEKLNLYLDPEFAEFAVEDKETGDVWFSNPYDFASDVKAGSDTQNTLQALVNLTYYDLTAKEGTMNSFSDCTSKDQYTIEKLDNGFALHMQIGHVEDIMLVPSTVEASKFESKILPNVSEKNAKRLNSYYTKVSLSDPKLSDSAREGYLKTSPGLTDNDFYILRDVVDREKRVIEGILKETEYTIEDMQEDLALSGYEDEDTISALFNMSVYVELDNGDLKVTVPADSISYDRTQFYLASFQLLNYFGAGKFDEEDSYLFIPDGSGALINYNRYGLKKILYTTNPVYGMDYSLSFNYELNSLSSQNYLPVYGNKDGEKAVLAIIEDGESMANVISESGNIISSYETVYPQFSYETAYTVNYTDSIKIKGLYTYHDTNAYTGNYVVRYRFLTGEEADYVGMAKSYQSYLIDQGVLTKLEDEDKNADFYVEALGAIEKTSTKFGIPYTESVPFTTFAQAKDILTDIRDAADVDLKLRYKGWMNGGMYYTVSNSVDIEKSLGGKKGLAQLESFAKENNIGFYPDADFFMASMDKKFDGYNSSSNSARSIRREILYLTSPQEFNNLVFFQYVNYSVSPYYYNKYMKSFFKDYNKLNLSNISSGNLGTMLYAEYDKKKAVNREQAKDIIVQALDEYMGDKGVMLDGGNAYTLPYVSELVNVPMYNSAYTLEDESIPFMQLVLHGYVPYAGEAFNLSGEYEEQFLRSIEYGSSPFFTVAVDNVSLLKKTAMPYYYSVDWAVLQDEIRTCAAQWKEAYDGLGNQAMVSHEKLSDDVSRTEYEDGTVFYVNYSDEEVLLEDGTKVDPRSYIKTRAQ